MTRELTVRQLAAISGVTVRTLHHYDAIGLLRPARVGTNGYRYYGRAERLRLQRILFHRELGVPLDAIAELLRLEGEDQVGALLRHRARIEAHRARLSELIETIDRTIAGLRGGSSMSNADLYRGFSAGKQAEYEAWLLARHGPGMRQAIDTSHMRWKQLDAAGREAAMRELQQIEEALAEACRRHIEVESRPVDELVGRHRAWVAMMWNRPCPPAAYAGLADLYQAHPDFVARYERLAPGFTAYLVRAMKAHAGREGGQC